MIARVFGLNAFVFFTVIAIANAQELTISGNGVPSGSVAFSIGDLDELEQVSFTTGTIWTDDEVTFSGVPVSTVLHAAGATGSFVEMIALNDYSATLSLNEVGHPYPIVATRLDGQEMPVRQYGPFWIVYPYDSDPVYQSERVYAQSVWQLRELTVSE